jgi:hypothetical protein
LKRIVVSTLLLLVSIAAFSEIDLSVGAGFQYTGQIYSIVDQNETLTAMALGVHTGAFYGGPVGLHAQLQFCFFPLQLVLENTPFDPTVFRTIMVFDLILGVGYRLDLTTWWRVVIGGGIHAAQISLIPLDTAATPDFGTDVALGAGVMVSMQFPVSRRFFISIDLQAAYDWFALVTDPRVDRNLGSGFSAGGAGGVGIIY